MGVQKAILTRDPSYYGAGTVIGADGNPKQIQGGTGTLALGVPGNIFDASPARIHTALVPAGGADVGTFVSGEGVIVNPREYALKGVAGDPLAPSLTLTEGMTASFMTFGHVVAYLKNANAILAGMDGSILVGAPAEYDATADYAVGDLVTKDGVVYKCNTAITGGETWTAGHWDALDATYTGTDLCVLEVNGLK